MISKERQQSTVGRLDSLLKDEDNSMYEVEVMLGETDETHIIRTIEYWDNEKRRWPQRQHFAVLVAEGITRRFFNVIQLLSHSIPIIAVQVNLVRMGDQQALHFSKVLDTYEEPEEEAGGAEIKSEADWRQQAPWTLDAAKALVELVSPVIGTPTPKFTKYYVALTVHGKNFFQLHNRREPKSNLRF